VLSLRPNLVSGSGVFVFGQGASLWFIKRCFLALSGQSGIIPPDFFWSFLTSKALCFAETRLAVMGEKRHE
jgi:hypothetical protein